MKTLEQCRSVEEIRVEIDALDQEVIALPGRRFSYVQASSKLKTSESDVRAGAF